MLAEPESSAQSLLCPETWVGSRSSQWPVGPSALGAMPRQPGESTPPELARPSAHGHSTPWIPF